MGMTHRTNRRHVAVAAAQLVALLGIQVTAFATGLNNGQEIARNCYSKHRGELDQNQCVDDGCDVLHGPNTPESQTCYENGLRELRRLRLNRIADEPVVTDPIA
jgi:hypothetical protein